MHKKYSILKIIFILWSVVISNKIVQCNESCWNNANDCSIKTILFENAESSSSDGISMQIDCQLNLNIKSQDHLKNYENDFQIKEKNLLLPRFMGIQSLMLDGCQTPLNVHTFGLELLPMCANITKASIRHFHMDTLKPLYCHEYPQQLQLQHLNIQFNEIAVIDENSFPPNYALLRDVSIENNLLKVIHKNTFKSIRTLENLYVVNEPALMLKFPDLFQYSSFSNIHLDSLKEMTSGIFNHLPENLLNLYVANTQLDDNVVLVSNSLALSDLTIKNCALQQFILHDVHSTVKTIDLSGNEMKMFTAYENNLKVLNLSNNQLEWLPLKWLENLTNLETLILRTNQIKILSLDNLFKAVPNGQMFDLSQNRLKYLQDYETGIEDAQLYQAHLKCDQNPWDCLWLHEFAHYHPEKFRILQYEKFISKINVNGLECIPAEKAPVVEKTTLKVDTTVPLDKIVNISAYTLMYGNPWEFKRNQRAEALIIVFMLPLGIALLFVLLYMWIYCQKIFHVSYYQNFPCMRHSVNHSAQRFDVVRKMPPRSNQTEPKRPLTRITDESEEGYEIPISGIISECNCMAQHNDEIAQCEKPVHITYEHLPTDEQPHRIYEEIIQVGGYDGRNESFNGIPDVDNTKPASYDHLSFK